MAKTFYKGWYDGIPNESKGNIVFSYWNHVVNTYPQWGEDHNDVSRYSAKHYIEALKVYMDAHSEKNEDVKFIIDIPLTEVYNGGYDPETGKDIPIFKTYEFIRQIVLTFERDRRVVAWYMADEPEVWGYSEVVLGAPINTNPELSYLFLKNRYQSIKELTFKSVIVIFCDTVLYKKRYEKDILTNGAFFDIFAFDHYPFASHPEYDFSLRKIGDFIKLRNQINPKMPILFVGQGNGYFEGVNNNARVPNEYEHIKLFNEFANKANNKYGYMLWSWTYADKEAKTNGNNLLDKIDENGTPIPQVTNNPTVPKITFWTRLSNFFKKIFF
jgi:hypothetical protein